MKKILFFFALITMLVNVQAYAQSFYPVKDAMRMRSGKYVAYSDGLLSASISAAQYQAVKSNPQDYFLVSYDWRNPDGFTILVHKDDFVCELLTVSAVDINEDCTEVSIRFSNGTVYTSKSQEWLQVLPEQKVQHFQINSRTRLFERYQSFVEVPADFQEHLVPDFGKNKSENAAQPRTIVSKPVPTRQNETRLTPGTYKIIEQ